MKKYDLFELLLKQQSNFPLSEEEISYLDGIDKDTKDSVLLVLNNVAYETERQQLLDKIEKENSEIERSIIR